ncbi:MAG TPA: hypothetical protein VGH11_00740 [Jatrophihabitans sp.]
MLGNSANLVTVILGVIFMVGFAWRVLRKLTQIVRLLRALLTLSTDVAALKISAATEARWRAEAEQRIAALERLGTVHTIATTTETVEVHHAP